ncbi:hypothetical protein [Litorilituus lipolyticus]|uniref:Glycine zipper domain-containing protein n=1 Tax=Litorilituus lipolyticus TaxID=2491017 RepID=A0A502KXP6_9GAMM|nr:hypothetical protein [Litorilituus lipolyticus]TPH15239.1 hypothetical protein EPA86_10530 [Litorilituus lipolyticus]
MNNLVMKTLLLSIMLFVINASVNAQTYVFPKNGQTKEQQQKDEYTCHSWAVSETGFDPLAPSNQTQSTTSTTSPAQASAQPGSGIRGAIGGAAAGAVIAEIGDNDVSNGAAKGAAIGALAGRRQSRRAAAQQQAAQVEAQQQALQEQQVSVQLQGEYNKARGICLEAKGYSVSN